MHDKERSIEGQSIIHSTGYNLDHKWLESLPKEKRADYLGHLFDVFAAKLDAYAKVDVNLDKNLTKGMVPPPPHQAPASSHLSDERVAAGVAREGQNWSGFCSAEERKTILSKSKEKGWNVYQLKTLCNRFGFQTMYKIPAKIYVDLLAELEKGPQLEETSTHLESHSQGETK